MADATLNLKVSFWLEPAIMHSDPRPRTRECYFEPIENKFSEAHIYPCAYVMIFRIGDKETKLPVCEMCANHMIEKGIEVKNG